MYQFLSTFSIITILYGTINYLHYHWTHSPPTYIYWSRPWQQIVSKEHRPFLGWISPYLPAVPVALVTSIYEVGHFLKNGLSMILNSLLHRLSRLIRYKHKVSYVHININFVICVHLHNIQLLLINHMFTPYTEDITQVIYFW